MALAQLSIGLIMVLFVIMMALVMGVMKKAVRVGVWWWAHGREGSTLSTRSKIPVNRCDTNSRLVGRHYVTRIVTPADKKHFP